MTRIELGPVPVKLQQCDHCGRIRGEDNVWRHLPAVIPDVVVTCATCGEWQAKLARVKQVRQGRELLRGRAKGYGAAPEGVDIWAGFREGE